MTTLRLTASVCASISTVDSGLNRGSVIDSSVTGPYLATSSRIASASPTSTKTRFSGSGSLATESAADEWPESCHGRTVIEVFAPPRYWLLNRLGVGARIEAGGSFHRMAIAGDCHCRVTTERGDVAMMLLFGW